MSLDLLLLLLGAGFLVANVRVVARYLRFRRLRREALVTWPAPPPAHYGLLLGLAVVFAALVVVKLGVQGRPPDDALGEAMMMLYYGGALPLGRLIPRGVFAHGLWLDRGYLPFARIGGLSWRAGDPPVLVVIHRARSLAERLPVPLAQLGAVRRVLRDKIAAHEIDYTTHGLGLGAHDERDDV